MTHPELLTVPEAAARARLAVSTIRKWILTKKIGHTKLGRKVFVLGEELNSLISTSYVPARKGEADRPE